MDFVAFIVLFIYIVSIILRISNLGNESSPFLSGNDMFFSYDPLENIRSEYARRLEVFYSGNKPRTYLKNNYCELRLITDGSGVYFYCKERSNGKRKGRFFEVKGDNAHVGTMWGIMDMEFNRHSTYNSMRSVYMSLNRAPNTSSGLRYYYEPLFNNKYPNYRGILAQNEYCRLELQTVNNQSVILCTDVWSITEQQFMIIANKYLLMNIIEKFEKEVDKFVTYSDLLAQYLKRSDCDIRVIKPEETEVELNKNDVQFSEKAEQKTEFDEKIGPEEQNVSEDKLPEIKDELKKYNERNLDL